jgi:unsaturated rhamnogalacturonyl hydrolase
MNQSLVPVQTADGMWRQLLDQPPPWQESSATAMFAWAMFIGIQQGILQQNQYKPAVKRAWAALLGKLQKDGQLTDICAGIGQSQDINYYLNRPRIAGDLHGQAPMLWLLTALLDD